MFEEGDWVGLANEPAEQSYLLQLYIDEDAAGRKRPDCCRDAACHVSHWIIIYLSNVAQRKKNILPEHNT